LPDAEEGDHTITEDYRNWLQPADPDAMRRWREDAERREQEIARAKRERQRAERASSVEEIRAAPQEEVAALRAELPPNTNAKFRRPG
jgi:hypothetical protein